MQGLDARAPDNSPMVLVRTNPATRGGYTWFLRVDGGAVHHLSSIANGLNPNLLFANRQVKEAILGLHPVARLFQRTVLRGDASAAASHEARQAPEHITVTPELLVVAMPRHQEIETVVLVKILPIAG